MPAVLFDGGGNQLAEYNTAEYAKVAAGSLSGRTISWSLNEDGSKIYGYISGRVKYTVEVKG